MSKVLISFVGFSVLLVALYYSKQRNQFGIDLNSVLNGLLYQESRYNVNTGNKVAVGFGSCWDIVANGVELMSSSEISPPDYSRHYDTISTNDELARSFAYFFHNGAAAERYISNKSMFQDLVHNAVSLIPHSEALGGNAPVIAQRLAHEGWHVLLASKMTERDASLLHKFVQLASPVSSAAESEEDIHLILEFDTGETWGQYNSPRGNRFIVHSDSSNMLLKSLEGFDEALKIFDPNLLIIGGLQLMDNFAFAPDLRTQRLKLLQSLLQSLPDKTKVHFEMASFVEQKLLSEIIEYVVPYVDSIGMNEQELSNLHSMLLYNNITHATEYNPRVATTLDQARTVYKLLHERHESKNKLISRLHVHTLAYQAIFTDNTQGWKHTRSAAAKAALMANRHVCASSSINTDKAKLLMDESFSISKRPSATRMVFLEKEPVSCWYEEHIKVCVAPNLVCTDIHKTAGAGDNISAAGLSIQL